ncbi:MAG: hypothetical protein HDS20_04775 [Bacteroides sp.]|nr:hypothetical protein [Bacteroides sp.]MBD5362498.1 hypothetical protein [Bacteroides sp.]
MSETEMNSYRFGTGLEPTDEMLAQIMHEAAEDAKRSNEEATIKYFEELRRGTEEQQAKWSDRIKEINNGNR